MGFTPQTTSLHRLRPGLPGSLIPFATLAFASQCQLVASNPLSPLVFFRISTHFTATPGVPITSPLLQLYSFERRLPVKPGDFTSNLFSLLHALYAQ